MLARIPESRELAVAYSKGILAIKALPAMQSIFEKLLQDAVALEKKGDMGGAIDVLEQATGKRLRRLPLPRRTAKWAIDRVPGVYRLTKIPSAAVDYFAHPTHYTVFQARTDLEGSGIDVPAFASYADRLVRFVREHPRVGSAAMV